MLPRTFSGKCSRSSDADLLVGLRDQREALRGANDAILTRAATEQRDLTGEELGEHSDRALEIRALDDRIEQVLADQVAELRAASTRRPGPAAPRDPGTDPGAVGH